ncbi:MAG: neutral/alkaline non-lysosomal ceramidase N-terminal domain-containing protein [Pirellulaceae bacterium]
MAQDAESPGEHWQQGDEYQIGVASIDITPNHPIRLNGFGFRREEAADVGLRLGAQALAISQGDEPPIVLVTLDSLGLRMSMADEVAARLAESHGLPRENLAFAFSHSHCTPKLAGACDTIFSTPIPAEHQTHIDRYTERLTNDLVAVVQDAIDGRQPGFLSWATGSVGFAVNRRTAGGPVDHSLPVLIARTKDGELLALHTAYACHCVTLSYNRLSGDWAGYAREAIERRWPGVTGLVAIGCGSDSNPDSGVTGDGEAIAAAQGQQICDEIARLLDTPGIPIHGAPVAATRADRPPSVAATDS